MLEYLFNELFKMSLIGGILGSVVIVIRFLLKNRLPKIFFYIMWILVFVKFILPINFTMTVNLSNNINNINNVIGVVDNEASTFKFQNNNEIYQKSNLGNFNTKAKSFYKKILLLLWFTGVGTFWFILILINVNLNKKFNKSKLISLSMRNSILLKKYPKIKIYENRNAISPMVLGIINPKIILPMDFNCKKGNTFFYIIYHEVEHIKWKDNLVNILTLLVLSFHWYNPILWISYILFVRDIEKFCDERVLTYIGANKRADYAESLLSCAMNKTEFATSYNMFFSKKIIKERIMSVMKYKKFGIKKGNSIHTILGMILLLFILGGCLTSLVSCSNNAYASNGNKSNVENEIQCGLFDPKISFSEFCELLIDDLSEEKLAEVEKLYNKAKNSTLPEEVNKYMIQIENMGVYKEFKPLSFEEFFKDNLKEDITEEVFNKAKNLYKNICEEEKKGNYDKAEDLRVKLYSMEIFKHQPKVKTYDKDGEKGTSILIKEG